MKKTITLIQSTILVLGLLFGTQNAFAATFTAVTSGDWSNPATWGGLAPSSIITADDIIVPSGITVYLDSDITLNGLTATLNVNGSLASSANEKLIMSNGDLQGSGNLMLSYLEIGTLGNMSFSGNADIDKMVNTNINLILTSVVNIADTLFLQDGNILLSTGANLGMNSNSTVVVDQGSVTISGGLFSSSNPYDLVYIGSSKTVGIEANGSGLVDLYIDLDDNQQSVSLIGQVVVGGNLHQQSGDIDMNGGDLTISGDYTTVANAEIIGDPISDITITSSGTLTSELVFATGSENLHNLILMGDGTTQAVLASNIAVSGELWIDNAILTIDNSATVTLENNTNITLNDGELDFVLGSSFDGTQSYDLLYMGSSAQTGLEVTGSGLNDLTISLNTDQDQIAAMFNLSVGGTLFLDKGNLDLNSNDLVLKGDFQSNGNAAISGDIASSITIQSDINDTLYFDQSNNALNAMTIDMSSGGDVLIGSDVEVNDLILNNGLILLAEADLTVSSGGSISGGNNNSYISTSGSGNLMATLNVSDPYMLYPVGNEDGYSPAMIQIANGNAGTFGVHVSKGVYTHGTGGDDVSITEKVVDRTWHLVEGTGSSTDINLMLSWSSAMELNGFDNTNAYITNYVSSNWDVDAAGAATFDGGMNLYSMERTGISSTGPFAVKDNESALSIDEDNDVAIQVYPNPTADILFIDYRDLEKDVDFTLVNQQGQSIEGFRRTQSGSIYTIDLSDLPDGVYYLQVINGEKFITKKIIKS